MASLVIDALSKSYPTPKGGAVEAVHGISLAVQPGVLQVLVGPSGSGKTTLLRMIAGLEEPTSGTIAIDGKVVNAFPPEDREVTMVFQDHALYPHLSVYENLAFGLKLRKFPRAEIDARVRETGELLGLTSLFQRSPEALSGGERQRVALGRALVVRPKVFLLDEPLSNLDAPLRAQMRREIVKLQRRLELTMMYVTHDQMEAMALADRMAVINAGALQQIGAPMDLYRRPMNLFVAGFLGWPPQNFFRGTLRHNDNGIWFSSDESFSAVEFVFRVRGKLGEELAVHSGKPVVLGLRAEHIRLLEQDELPRASEVSLEAAVDSIESLGHETHIWLMVGKRSFVARLQERTLARAGQQVRVALDVSQGHFFDAAQENRLA